MTTTSGQLREKRAKVIADARSLYDDALKNGAVPDEINAKFEEMMAESDRLAAQITNIERLESQEAAMNAVVSRRAGHEGVSEDQVRARQEFESRVFDSYIRRGMNGLNDKEREFLQQRFTNVASGASGPEGGYTVPDTFYQQLITAELAFGGMIAASNVIDTATGNNIMVTTENDTSNEGAIVGENVDVSTGTDMSFAGINFGAHLFTSRIVKIPNTLLQDSVFDLAAFLTERLGTRIARIVNKKMTIGTGAMEPKGLVPAATLGVTAASQTVFKGDELIDLVHSIDPAYRMSGCGWMFNDTTLKALRKLKDGNGNYIWQSGLLMKEPDSILGFPYSINQHFASPAQAAKPIVFGQLKKYWIRRVAGAQLIRLTERYAEYNQTAFLAFQRFDGNLVDAGTHPVKYLANAS